MLQRANHASDNRGGVAAAWGGHFGVGKDHHRHAHAVDRDARLGFNRLGIFVGDAANCDDVETILQTGDLADVLAEGGIAAGEDDLAAALNRVQLHGRAAKAHDLHADCAHTGRGVGKVDYVAPAGDGKVDLDLVAAIQQQ